MFKSSSLFLLLTLLAAGLLGGCQSQRSDPGEPSYRSPAERSFSVSQKARQHYQRGNQLLEAGNLKEAELAYRRALTADIGFGPAHNNLGKVYYLQQRYYEAAWEFEYAAKLMPHQPEPRNNLGMVFEAVGRLEQAIAEYDKALDIAPEYPEIVGNLARAKLRRGDKDQQVRLLLEDLIMKDTRQQWVDWARQKLATMPKSSTK